MASAKVTNEVLLDGDYVRAAFLKNYWGQSRRFAITLCALASLAATNSMWGVVESAVLQWIPAIVPGVFSAWAGLIILFKKDLTRRELLVHNSYTALFVSVPLILCNALVVSLIWWVSYSLLNAPVTSLYGRTFVTLWDYVITVVFGGLGLQFVAALAAFVVCGLPRYLQLRLAGA